MKRCKKKSTPDYWATKASFQISILFLLKCKFNLIFITILYRNKTRSIKILDDL